MSPSQLHLHELPHFLCRFLLHFPCHVSVGSLILSEKLYPHLLEIDRAARERMDAMLPRMMEAAGVTEELKSRDPMRWVGLMNTLKAQAEEIIQDELIYN